MTTVTRPCLSCQRLTRHGSRCPACQAAHAAALDQRRGTRQQRGYGAAWQVIRQRILERDEETCHYCGGPATTVDHVRPKAAGGTDDEVNLVAACLRCNARKGAR